MMFPQIEAPKAKKINKTISLHGDDRVDPYYWLNDRENPEVIAYLQAENSYHENMMAPFKELKETIYQEIIGRIKQTDDSVPVFYNGYWYQSRYEEKKEYPIHIRKKTSLDNEAEILLDVNVIAKDYSYFQLSGYQISPDNKTMAYGEDTVSRRLYTLRIMDLSTGNYYPELIKNTSGHVTWANDNKTFFYTIKDEMLRDYKVMRHVLGTDPANDELIYHEEDETFHVSVGKSKSKKYILIFSGSTLTTECRYIHADNPFENYTVFHGRQRELEYYVDHKDDSWYIRHNLEGKNYRLSQCSENDTQLSSWKEIIAHRNDILLEDFELFNHYLVLTERIEGLLRLHIYDDKQQSHYIHFDESVYNVYAGSNPQLDTDILRIAFNSLKNPGIVYDYHMEQREKKLLKQMEVVGGYDPEDYHTERFYAPAEDGTKIPISLIYKKSVFKHQAQPLLLYGYGSYGISIDPGFSLARISLLERGFIFAIAHIRGGQEMGYHWYEDGKLMKKKNTFTDFINCAEFLIEKKYTDPSQLFAFGGSAGGLLMGAVVNLRPELWKGIIAAVPFVDVVTTMMDDSIPLTTGEYDEWGNPADQKYYDYIKSYSPYDNVEIKSYPAMLVTTGLHDSQVQYWEPAKYVAKLRDLKIDDNPLLMWCNMETGHGGASGRFKAYEETAMEYAFLIGLL